ncbi:MAG TPA: nucleoside transporter C-terminal domain-containing protein [Coleofasciculaceae cyanobacterium]|jgi:CNT family concentrative nucleoside transporter
MGPLTGLVGIIALLLTAYALSNNRKAINWRLIASGLALQLMLAVFCLKVPLGRELFHQMGQGIEKLLSFSDAGASFVFGFLVSKPDQLNAVFGPGSSFIFAFKLIPTIIFVSALVSIGYHLGLMQRLVQVVAWLVYKLMGASGAEALSNAASIFVGQVEAQLLIKPYVPTMTRSELLAAMAGSLACIAGGVMAVYIQMGIPAEYMLTASVMAVPGALVIAKLIYPETEPSPTRGEIKLEIKRESVNLIDAAARGAGDGMKIGIGVTAMLIAFIALINMTDFLVGQLGLWLASTGMSLGFIGLDLQHLSLQSILGSIFSVVAVLLGVPLQDAHTVGGLLGTKIVLNEFVAFSTLSPMLAAHTLDPRSVAIVTFALCGFANFGSVAIQVGGIGEMAPNRKHDLAELGLRALLCGTMASYVSGALAGVLVGVESSAAGNVITVALIALAIGVILLARKLPMGALPESSQPTSPAPFSGPLVSLEDIAAVKPAIPAEESKEGVS